MKGLCGVGCLYADNNDYDDDDSNSSKGVNIVLKAMAIAINDDSIIEC